ncbi:MAG: PRC-barrel domain-containing protein [Candidatus Thermoplasmatota archaeon]|jgi:sporulation protein YlmC with PRC-barrel domain|nr:PRC-barrel domain-containing protein [Candidatus Thermoplasmatota archaeon]MCW6168480.1 PRC-barrel domain-containing protein [Thermoplasmatales archaeon]MCW6169618.1 PRC-barrel domain-containing protein [Thermoplasmatales archaeon]
MMTEVTELFGLPVYTDKGILVGDVSDLILDLEQQNIYGLYVESPNPQLVEGGSAISIPYRWIRAVGEIVILRKFPSFLKAPE